MINFKLLSLQPLRLNLIIVKKSFVNFKIRVLWRENSLGLAIDQININRSNFLTSYYFWPRTNAWEQLKNELNSKLWISESERVLILNRVSDIMNYWQKNRKQQSLINLKKKYKDIDFVGTL